MMIDRLTSFHKTRRGYGVFALVELGLAYLFASIAIDTGNLWTYATAIILFIGGLINLVNFLHPPAFGKLTNARRNR